LPRVLLDIQNKKAVLNGSTYIFLLVTGKQD